MHEGPDRSAFVCAQTSVATSGRIFTNISSLVKLSFWTRHGAVLSGLLESEAIGTYCCSVRRWVRSMKARVQAMKAQEGVLAVQTKPELKPWPAFV